MPGKQGGPAKQYRISTGEALVEMAEAGPHLAVTFDTSPSVPSSMATRHRENDAAVFLVVRVQLRPSNMFVGLLLPQT